MRKLALTLFCIMTFQYLSSGTNQHSYPIYIKSTVNSDIETILYNRARVDYFKKLQYAAELQLQLQKQLENK